MRARQTGLTLVEAVVTMVALAPIMIAVISTMTGVTRSVNTNLRVSDVSSNLLQASETLAALARGASIQRTLVRDAPDKAWAPPLLARTYPGVRLTMRTGQRAIEIELVRDGRDPVNGRDDDADGLIDEGSLEIRHGDGRRAVLSHAIESCRIGVDGMVLSVDLVGAKRDGDRQTHRRHQSLQIAMRNP